MKDYVPLTPKYPHILHGADYNPDQWLDNPQVLGEDIRLMKKTGINCVSLGIFSWAKLEPKEGEYHFDWMKNIIDTLYENGIYTILATPSGAKPIWMSEKYPEIRRVSANLVRDLSGFRHNHCYSSPVYRDKITQINTLLAKNFSNHPGVILWHISNEYNGDCYCLICQQKFREWLKEKYKTLDALNHAWWTDFWSHTYTDWNQISAPVSNGEIKTHGLNLDWKRFVTYQTIDFMETEIKAVKAVNPDIPVTTNFMGFYNGLNYFKFKDFLDVISWDNYPEWHKRDDAVTAAYIAGTHDLMRSIKNKPFLMMESSPSVTNWQPVSKLLHPGMYMLSSLQAVAHGSQSVQYFQWRKSRGSCEKFHGAVVDHCGRDDTRVFKDVEQVGNRLKALDSTVYETQVKAEVAVVYDWENMWALEDAQGPRNCGLHYTETVQNHYAAFWKLGVPVDFVDMECDISGYKLVVAPMLYMYRNGFEEKMKNFVQNGGTLIGTYWSGIVDDTDLCMLGGWPGKMMDVFGIWNEEIDALYEGETNQMKMMTALEGVKDSYTLSRLCERIHPQGADILAVYTQDFYSGEAVFTRNSFGKGVAYYLAANTESIFQDDFYAYLVKQLNISRSLESNLPYGVTASRRVGETDIVFLQNYTKKVHTISLPHAMIEVESGRTLLNVELEPYGVCVLEDKFK